MKKIFVILGLVCFIISIQSCKVPSTINKISNTPEAIVDTNKHVIDGSKKLDYLTPTQWKPSNIILPVAVGIVKVDNLKLFVTKEIVAFYNCDTLVKKTSLAQLQRDKSILQTANHKDSVLNKKISDLEEYHKAKSLLSEKYDSLVVNNTIKSLTDNQFSQNDSLISLLKKYADTILKLRSLILKINQTIENYRIRDQMVNMIYTSITQDVFFFLYPNENNNTNMFNYPFVIDICHRIWAIKRKDLNGDISYLLGEI